MVWIPFFLFNKYKKSIFSFVAAGLSASAQKNLVFARKIMGCRLQPPGLVRLCFVFSCARCSFWTNDTEVLGVLFYRVILECHSLPKSFVSRFVHFFMSSRCCIHGESWAPLLNFHPPPCILHLQPPGGSVGGTLRPQSWFLATSRYLRLFLQLHYLVKS